MQYCKAYGGRLGVRRLVPAFVPSLSKTSELPILFPQSVETYTGNFLQRDQVSNM
jgi:hypothetical protein